jgi:hypothetical protein
LRETSHVKKRGGLTVKEGPNVKRFLIFNGITPVIALKNKNRLND